MCHEWNALGDVVAYRYKIIRGVFGSFLAVVVVLYGLMASILLLDSKTSCLEIVGGSGCGR